MAVTEARNIGIEVTPPTKACSDPHCPFHGSLSVRGITIDGRVASTKMEKSVVVEREFLFYVPKYERYEKRTRRFTAHHPPCIPLAQGDEVTIMECRPISKTKSFVVVESRKGGLRVAGEDYTTVGKDAPKATKAKASGAQPQAAAKPKKAAAKKEAKKE